MEGTGVLIFSPIFGKYHYKFTHILYCLAAQKRLTQLRHLPVYNKLLRCMSSELRSPKFATLCKKWDPLSQKMMLQSQPEVGL